MKHANLSRILSVCLLSCSLPITCEDIAQTRAKDKEVIASHIMGIVNNVVTLAQDPKDEDVVGANIVALFGNILGCIFAASKRGNIPFDMSEEEMEALLESLDDELIEAVHQAVVKRAKQIRGM